MSAGQRPPRAARFPAALDDHGSGRGGALRGQAGGLGAQPLLRPQRPLREAARQPSPPPSGQGLDSSAVRLRMVQRLRAQGVQCEPVLAAMASVARHAFVDTAFVAQAYEDTSLPIGWAQTISKPAVVARMLALLVAAAPRRAEGAPPLGRVLEIGTGCGYQAALLGVLARHVTSIERLKPLHDKARTHLDAMGMPHVRLLHADGRLGYAPHAPFDAIISAAGGETLPEAWLQQLAPGGRLVAPMHDAAAGGQVLRVVDRDASGAWHHANHDAVHFVPLKSGLN